MENEEEQAVQAAIPVGDDGEAQQPAEANPALGDGAAQGPQAPADPGQPGAQQQPPVGEQAGLDVLARLANALERIGGRDRAPAPVFKAPKYNGTGDVEYFLDQFTEVAEANGWDDASTLIHLRESLKDEARECGRSPTLQGVEDRLRTRFGLTPREARAKLALCKKAPKTSLQQHADDISRLVQRGYLELEPPQRRTLAVEAFINSLGNPALQRHLLAINPAHLATAVKACNEFLSVKDAHSSSVRQVDDEAEMTSVQTLSTKDRESIDNLAKTVQELAKQVAGLKKENIELRQGQTTAKRTTEKKTTTACWGCRKEGHQRKDCKTHPWPTPAQKKDTVTGNVDSPQQ